MGAVRAHHDLLIAIRRVIRVLEAPRTKAPTRRKRTGYTYEEIEVKRWILDDGGASGNCETCEENADRGWIPDGDVFVDSDGGDIDGPSAHPHCECTLEYGTKRKRVYA